MSFRSVSAIGILGGALGLLCLSPAPAHASGFQINEHSASAMGRGNSVVATINEPSAIFHNPAGLTGTEGTQFELGLTMIAPKGSYTGPGLASTNPDGTVVTQNTTSDFIPVPNAYVTRALSSKAFIGFGFYAPYGLKLVWDNPDRFVGRTVSEQSDVKTFFLTPTIALKLSDMVSVAVGVSLVPATVYLRRTLGSSDNGQVLFPRGTYDREGKIDLSASAFGVGANAGVQLAFDQLRLGLTFRSAVDLAFSGKAHFTLPTNIPSEVRANFPDGDATADLTLPHSFGAGVGWVEGPLAVELSGQLTLWKSFEELRVNFSSLKPAPTSSSPRNWTTAPLVRIGGQYQLGDAVLRAGAGYDFTPVPKETVDPTLPDNNRFYFTLGGGYSFGVIRADLAYMGLTVAPRDAVVNVNFPQTAPGTYNSTFIHLIGLSLGAKI